MTAGTIPDHLTIGQWIKRLRAYHEWTQEALANEVACATQTIHAIEGGQRKPSRALAERIAAVLDVPPEQREAFVRLARGAGALRKPDLAPTAAPGPAIPVVDAPAAPHRPRLPNAPNILIGRQHEEDLIKTMLDNPAHRLVTLVGPGGAGKSRLALQTAHDCGSRYGDGVAWVALAPVTDPSQIAVTIATAIGHSIGRTQSPNEEIIALLRDRDMLLVLDNIEHLLSGVDLLVTLLQEAPNVRLLITSRERLRLGGEAVLELDGLALPADDTPTTVVRSSAVLLFLERARQLDPSFALMPSNQTEVAGICRLLHGMPLAIELAASWIRLLAPAEILDEIERSLDFLDLGGRDASPRHRSLRAVFDYSWGLLTPEEQRALARLAVFRGGATRDAAKAVAGASAPLLAALVDKSLVRRVESTTGTSRYDLHELVRQFAEQRLNAMGQLADTRTAHMRWMLALAEDSHDRIAGADAMRIFTILQSEQSNIRHALGWIVQQQQIEPGLRMTAALKRWWFHQGYLTEGRGWYDQVLRTAADAPPSHYKGRVLAAAGDLARWQGDYDHAVRLLEASTAVYAAIDEPLGVARANLILGGIASMRQEITHATELCVSSLETFRAIGYERGILQALNAYGNVLAIQGDYAGARLVYEEQLALVRESGDITELSIALNNFGVVVRHSGDLEHARMLHEEALAISEALHSIAGMAWATRLLGAVAFLAGEYDVAHQQLRRSLALRWEIRERAGIIWAVEGLAELAAAQHQYERAITLWAAAAALTGPIATTERSAEHLATEANIAAVRASVDAPLFERAWAAGQSMTMEAVVDYCLC